MQFKSILLVAASATLAFAGDYKVGNCGDMSGMSSETEDVCKALEGKYCGGTGMKRCVIEEDKWEDFGALCKKAGEEEVFARPGTYSKDTAKQMALCF